MSFKDRLAERVLTGDVFFTTTKVGVNNSTTLPSWQRFYFENPATSGRAICLYRVSYYVGKLTLIDVVPFGEQNLYQAAEVYSLNNRPDLGAALDETVLGTTLKVSANQITPNIRNSLRLKQSAVQIYSDVVNAAVPPVIGGFDTGFRELIPLGQWRVIENPPTFFGPGVKFVQHLNIPVLSHGMMRWEWWEE